MPYRKREFYKKATKQVIIIFEAIRKKMKAFHPELRERTHETLVKYFISGNLFCTFRFKTNRITILIHSRRAKKYNLKKETFGPLQYSFLLTRMCELEQAVTIIRESYELAIKSAGKQISAAQKDDSRRDISSSKQVISWNEKLFTGEILQKLIKFPGKTPIENVIPRTIIVCFKELGSYFFLYSVPGRNYWTLKSIDFFGRMREFSVISISHVKGFIKIGENTKIQILDSRLFLQPLQAFYRISK
ncbi:hypothetical protein ACFL35_17645 [Candidatus Riflebacteria bacterium]